MGADSVGAVWAVGAVGVGRAGAVGVGTGLGAVEAVGTAGAMATFRVAAIFALQPVLLLLCAPLLCCWRSGHVCDRGHRWCWRKKVGCHSGCWRSDAHSWSKVAAIFALQPVVRAIVAVGALGGWKVGTVATVGAAVVGGKGG